MTWSNAFREPGTWVEVETWAPVNEGRLERVVRQARGEPTGSAGVATEDFKLLTSEMSEIVARVWEHGDGGWQALISRLACLAELLGGTLEFRSKRRADGAETHYICWKGPATWL